MGFKVPLTFSSNKILVKRSKFLQRFIRHKKDSKLSELLKGCGTELNRREYLAIAWLTFIQSFILIYIASTTVLGLLGIRAFYVVGIFVALLFSLFILFVQLSYPRVFVSRRERNIEKNLLSALEDMLVQLSSGIPLFEVMVNISDSGYGELSEEFKKAVRKINAGSPDQEVLSELSRENPSPFFKRTLWQISNGLNAGSDMTQVIKDSIRSLNEEQLIQIQNYGNKLNPLVVFYMLSAVIVPALSITFLTIFSSMVNLSEQGSKVLFFGLFILVVFIQIMFLGIIKSRRPSLL